MSHPERPPQLRMVCEQQQLVSEVPLAPGFACREVGPESVGALADVLNRAYPGAWPEARAREALVENASVPVIFLVWRDDTPVASASYLQMYDRFPATGWVHYVGARPDFAGNRLGEFVTWSVAKRSFESGDEKVRLSTDDGRLAAISAYLKVGFTPEMVDPSHSERWDAVFSVLSQRTQRVDRGGHE